MALIKTTQGGANKLSIDSGVSVSNRWYPVAVIESDGTVHDPASLASMPSSGEFWSVSDGNMIATKQCHITGYNIYAGAANWSTIDVTCNVGDTIMSASYLGGYVMRAELL